ncbi:galactarate dehydratase [Aurantibacter crassamenti]|uniref:galactarate dehydratase n=1 Tax=Aurantibacter crassamenti TaxID=1837375 RepID=UPI001939BE3F|nr:galactarate dehydratase [Aurantibacter crassamenti]MBM1105838.1 galactarate dehydratase [Aurantibacter crassamenti]
MVASNDILIKASDADNVGIVVNPKGLQVNDVVADGLKLLEYVPMGHKVALKDIQAGGEIIRYGQKIAYAIKTLKAGSWVNELNISLPDPPILDLISIGENSFPKIEKLTGYTFEGYLNKDGSVGTKNVLGITTSVQCVAGLTEYVVSKIKKELLSKYSNVDDVVGLTHSYGCGVAINAPAAIIPIRTIKNIATNPNFGGEVMVLGLGCEKLRPESIVPENKNEEGASTILYMQDENFHGFSEMVKGIMKIAENHLRKLNQRKRETYPISNLVVGMQCGGSDAFSGITANPVAGFASDLIVRAGGSVLFSEVTEVRDAVHLLVPRTTEPEVSRALLNEMKWYDEYLLAGQVDRSENTSPGNKKGGLSTIVEKSLGSIAKSGTSPIVDVIPPGDKLKKKGLNFAATPAGDFVCGTLQLAAGMNVHVFMTGRGTPYGLSMVPVIKVSSNSELSNRWYDLIDFDAGKVATGQATIEELGWELFHLIIDVASGKTEVACDKLGLHNDLVLFNPGPLT